MTKGMLFMKLKIKGLRLLLSLILCFTLVVSGVNINAATKVKINKKTASIYVGKTVQLKITGTKKKVSWKSSNKKVATVTTKGKVKGIKKGTAKITATVSKKKYTCKVTVKEKTTPNTNNANNNEEVDTISSNDNQNTNNTSVISLDGIDICNYNEDYETVNGLNIRVTSIATKAAIEGENFISYVVKYTITNNTKESLKEPVGFRLFNENGTISKMPSTNAYVTVSPGEYIRECEFTQRKTSKPVVLELMNDTYITFSQYQNTLNPNELHWLVPDDLLQ